MSSVRQASADVDEPGVGVGEQRRRRIAKGDAGKGASHPVGRLGHERGVSRDRDRQDDGTLGAHLLRERRAGLDGGTLAGDDDLARRVAVGDDEDPVCPGALDELRQARIVEPDDGGHRAVAALPGCLHQPAALAHEPEAVVEVEGACGDEGRVLAHRMAGREGGLRRDQALGGPPLAKRGEDRDRGRKDRRLGLLGEIEALGGTVPGDGADRLAEGAIGGREHGGCGGRGLGERSAHPDRLRSLSGKHEGKLRHVSAEYGAEADPHARVSCTVACIPVCR